MTTKEHAELLDLVISRAPKLREAGVIELGLAGGITLKLAAAADADAGDTDEEDQPEANAWNDPASYGRVVGVPGNDPRKKKG